MRSFIKFASARTTIGRPLKIGEIGLDNSQYTNFSHLRHFGLIFQPNGRGDGWEMTPLGWDFLHGKERVLTPAGHMAGLTLGSFHKAWATHDERRAVTIRDVLPAEWKERPEYAAERAG